MAVASKVAVATTLRMIQTKRLSQNTMLTKHIEAYSSQVGYVIGILTLPVFLFFRLTLPFSIDFSTVGSSPSRLKLESHIFYGFALHSSCRLSFLLPASCGCCDAYHNSLSGKLERHVAVVTLIIVLVLTSSSVMWLL